MKARIAVKILRNCGYDLDGYKGPVYSKHQVKKAVYTSVRDLTRVEKFNVMCDYLSGGCHDTFRWRGCESMGWEEPWLNFETAHRIGQYLV